MGCGQNPSFNTEPQDWSSFGGVPVLVDGGWASSDGHRIAERMTGQTLRRSTSYRAIDPSREANVMPSVVACATSIRSKGSR